MWIFIKFTVGMINGHGDDIYKYNDVRCNFSSNIYAGFSHYGLFDHLRKTVHLITNYPEPSPVSLERQIAEIKGIDAECVMATNGATEAIYLIARTFHHCEPIIPQPTFSEYADACRDNRGSRRIWWLCVPNNPTGHVIPKKELLDTISANSNDVFVVDASYSAYTKQDVLRVEEVVGFNNVIMLCSMTKDYGVPGLRLGYVVGNSRLLDMIRANRSPWSVNALAIEAGHYLLAHNNEYTIPVDMLVSERQRVERELHTKGITTSKSDSHMLLCRLPHSKACDLKEYLVDRYGILIRDASNFETLTPQHFRIAVQTEKQNDELLNALTQWISQL
jgi:threonine-phosphate decarboxylase